MRRVFCLALFTAVLAASAPAKAEPPSLTAPKPIKPADGDDELRKLLVARYNSVVTEIDASRTYYGDKWKGPGADLARRLVTSWVEINPADEVPLREQLVELYKAEEKAYEKFVKDGLTPAWTLEPKRYARLDAEIELLRAKRKAAAK